MELRTKGSERERTRVDPFHMPTELAAGLGPESAPRCARRVENKMSRAQNRLAPVVRIILIRRRDRRTILIRSTTWIAVAHPGCPFSTLGPPRRRGCGRLRRFKLAGL